MKQTASDQIRALKLNQSIAIKGFDRKTIYVLCSRIGSQLGRKFVTRDEENVHRVWRIQ